MKGSVYLLVSALVFGIVGIVLLFVAFFTPNWLQATRTNVSVVELHGLWDHGIQDLNCDMTPFGICMYTRGGLFTSMVLMVPGLFFLLSSVTVNLSGGELRITGGFSKASAIFFTMSDLSAFIGILLFTLQHTTCITSCLPTFSYYTRTWNTITFQFSFYLAWVSVFLQFVIFILLYIYSSTITKKLKTTYYIKEDNDKTPFEPTAFQPEDNRV